ncbi:MAG: hypothetical protein KKG59_01755 [Nanoarchaeota archaeon]|nr:hypothetical protein [Nanoarchaeota archaeon]
MKKLLKNKKGITFTVDLVCFGIAVLIFAVCILIFVVVGKIEKDNNVQKLDFYERLLVSDKYMLQKIRQEQTSFADHAIIAPYSKSSEQYLKKTIFLSSGASKFRMESKIFNPGDEYYKINVGGSAWDAFSSEDYYNPRADEEPVSRFILRNLLLPSIDGSVVQVSFEE